MHCPKIENQENNLFNLLVKHSAFTLAEVLITLGIVGVVAAITMPVLIEKYQDMVTVNKVKSTYSILYQAIKMSESQQGLLSDTKLSNVYLQQSDAKIIAEWLKPSLKLLKDCGTLDTNGACIYKGYYKRLNGKELNGWWQYYAQSTGDYKVVLTNGVSVWWRNKSGSHVDFYIDINGPAKPNRYGFDTFALVYVIGEAMYPGGSPGLSTALEGTAWQDGCTASAMGECTYELLKTGKRDYLKLVK